MICQVFDICARNSGELAIKHSIEISILLNFVNLSTIFCPRLYVKIVDLADEFS